MTIYVYESDVSNIISFMKKNYLPAKTQKMSKRAHTQAESRLRSHIISVRLGKMA